MTNRGNNLHLILTVGNTYVPVIDWLLDEFGGTRHVQYRTTRNLHSWRLGIRTNRHVVEGILPYSIIKKRQLAWALELCDLSGHHLRVGTSNGGLPPEVAARRIELIRLITEDKRVTHAEN